MAGLDISSLMQTVSQTLGTLAQGSTILQNNASAQEQITNANAALAMDLGKNQQIVESTKLQGDLATQRARVAAGNALGMNLNGNSAAFTQLADTINTQYAEKEKALQAYQAKQSINFFDDPIGYIQAQLTMDDDAKVFNAAATHLESAQQQLQALNALTQGTAQTQNMLTESLTQASIDANAAKIQTQATIAANEERIKGLVYNSDGIKAALSASREQREAAFSVFGAQKAQEQMAVSLAHLDLARQEFSWKKEEKEKGQMADDYLIDQINRGGALRAGDGYIPIEKGTAKAAQIVSLMKSDTPAGNQFRTDYLISMQTPDGGNRLLSPTPAGAAQILQTVPVKLAPAQEPIRHLLEVSAEEVRQAVDTGKIDPKDKAKLNKVMNDSVQGAVNRMAKEVKPGDVSNLYQIGKLSEIIAASPELQKSPVVTKVLGPAIKSGVDLSDPKTAFTLVGQALKDKKLTYNEAIELTSVYSVGQSVNLAARSMTSFGIVPQPSYNARVPTTADPLAIFGRSQVVDLTKPDQLGRALNKYLSASQNLYTGPQN